VVARGELLGVNRGLVVAVKMVVHADGALPVVTAELVIGEERKMKSALLCFF